MSACTQCGRRDGWAPTFRLLLRANRLLRAQRSLSAKLRHALRLAEARYAAERALRVEAEAERDRARDLAAALEVPPWPLRDDFTQWERSMGDGGPA